MQSWASHSQICKQMQRTHPHPVQLMTLVMVTHQKHRLRCCRSASATKNRNASAGTENSAQEGQVVIKSERPDDGYDLHLTSSAPAELVQLSNSGDAFDDLNVKTEVQDPGCTVDDQDGDDASEVIAFGSGYWNPYSDSESEASDTSSLSSFEDCW